MNTAPTITLPVTLSFTAKVDYATGNGPYSVTSADVNADGKADLVVAYFNSDTVSVLLNNGSVLARNFTEQTPLAVNPGLLLSDADGNADWNGGSLKAQITANAKAADCLHLSSTNPGASGIWMDAAGNKLMAGSTQIGTADAASVTNGTAWTLSFNASATNALVQATGQALMFNNTSDTPGTVSRSITLTATDKFNASANAVQSLTVTPVNDAPSIAGIPGSTQAVTTGRTAVLADFTVADAEQGVTSLSVTLTATNGTINANYYDKKIVCSRRYNGGHMAKRLINTIAITLGMLAATAVVAGGAYTKIANNGAALPDNATLGSGPNDWACTRDNAIGLLWEVGGWRDQSQQYTNYDTNWGQAFINNTDNSIGLANAANAVNLCGYADWRRPSKNELWNLMWWGKTPAPLIDQTYFPDTPIEYYWSSDLSGSGWLYNGLVVTTADGSIFEWLNRNSPRRVRLVRSAQFITHSVSLTGNGAGRVVADGIDCTRMAGVNDGTCSNASAWKDAPVTLTATSFPGSIFSAWGGACSGSASTCTLTLTANTAVTAAFSVPVATRSIVIDSATPANVYAALDGSGIYRSTDSGASWTAATTQPTNLNLKALVIKPGSPATLFAASYGGGVFKSSDSAATWAACAAQPANLNLLSLAIDASGKLYAGSEAGVFVSSNDCTAWTVMNTGLPL